MFVNGSGVVVVGIPAKVRGHHAGDEDVILVDVDAWREAATARLLPDGDTAAAQAR